MRRENKLFLQYIGPSMAGMLIAGSFSIVDTVFIGQGTGKTGLAAVALTWPLVMIYGALGELIGSGAAVLIAQARGGGELEKARRIFGNMLTLNVLFAASLCAAVLPCLHPVLRLFGATPELLPISASYAAIMTWGAPVTMLMGSFISVTRNDGRPVLAMLLVIVGLVSNIILDWLLILHVHQGAAGAAYATVISQTLSAVLGAGYFLTRKTELHYSLRTLRLHLPTVWEILLTGIPVFGNMLSIIAMLFMHNLQALRYGAVDGLAAYTLVAGLESLGSLLMSGLAMGIQPLAAYMYGARQHRRRNRMGNRGYRWAFFLGVILMFFCFALRNVMPAWGGLTGHVAELAAHGVLLSSPAFLLLGVIRVAGFYYQSTGKIGSSSLLIYGDAFFALPLCLFTLPLRFGMDGVWLAMPISRVILFAMLCYLWFGKRRERSRYAGE